MKKKVRAPADAGRVVNGSPISVPRRVEKEKERKKGKNGHSAQAATSRTGVRASDSRTADGAWRKGIGSASQDRGELRTTDSGRVPAMVASACALERGIVSKRYLATCACVLYRSRRWDALSAMTPLLPGAFEESSMPSPGDWCAVATALALMHTKEHHAALHLYANAAPNDERCDRLADRGSTQSVRALPLRHTLHAGLAPKGDRDAGDQRLAQ